MNSRLNIVTENPKTENISFLLIIYKSVTKNPTSSNESQEKWAAEKAIPIRFTKVNVIIRNMREVDIFSVIKSIIKIKR